MLNDRKSNEVKRLINTSKGLLCVVLQSNPLFPWLLFWFPYNQVFFVQSSADGKKCGFAVRLVRDLVRPE